MKIAVFDKVTEEEIFKGEAEDFLFANDNDEDIATCLDELERAKEGTTAKFYSYLGAVYDITKLVDYIE